MTHRHENILSSIIWFHIIIVPGIEFVLPGGYQQGSGEAGRHGSGEAGKHSDAEAVNLEL
jgi:hypothetical protein